MSFSAPTPHPGSYLGSIAINPPSVIQATRAPGNNDISYNIGDLWINTATQISYELVGYTLGLPVWTILGGAAGAISTINTNAPIGGNYTLAGTAAQIAVAETAGTSTFSLTGPYTPATYTNHGILLGSGAASIRALGVGATGTLLAGVTGADPAFTGSPSVSGSLTAATTITATLGAITATNGNLVLGTAGNKILSTSVATTTVAGANSFGTVALVGGTATIATSAITATSQIMLSRQGINATGANPLGLLAIGTVMANTSFVINAWSDTDATALATTDVSTIGWMIIN